MELSLDTKSININSDYDHIHNQNNESSVITKNIPDTDGLEIKIGDLSSAGPIISHSKSLKNIHSVMASYILEEQSKSDELHKDFIEQNYNMCYEKIPNFLYPVNLIIIDIVIGGVKLNALVDTGATCCLLFHNTVKKCQLEYLVDNEHTIDFKGASGDGKSIGKIWYLDMYIQNYSIPCSFDIIKTIDNKFDMILGINFLAAHRIDIDFHNNKLVFSKHFQAKFDLQTKD